MSLVRPAAPARATPAAADGLLDALAGSWQAVASHHQELPAVIIGIGRGSRRGAQRRTLGHFAQAAWSPVADGGAPEELRASSAALEQAIAVGDLDTLRRLLARSAELVIAEARALSRDAGRIVGEVLLTPEGLAGSPVEILALVLHEAAHSVANARGVRDTSRQGRYHNARFRAIAEELGLEVIRDPPFGWSSTAMPIATAARYCETLMLLEAALAGAPPVRSDQQPIRAVACECGPRARTGPRGSAALAVLCTACRRGSGAS